MQYPPPNTLLTDCYLPGGKYAQPSENPNAPTISPNLSFPSDLSLLLPSWKSCTYADWGLWDPPSTLGKATAMVAASASSVPAAPGAQVSPAHAPATPTPDPKDPQGDAANPAASAVHFVDLGAPSDPLVNTGLANQQGQRSSNTLKSDGQGSKMTTASTAHPPTNDAPTNNDLSVNDSPSSVAPSKTSPMANDPFINHPPKSDPSSSNSLSNNNSPNSDHPKANPPANGPQRNSEPSSNNVPINNNPSTNDPPSINNPPNNDASKNDLTSIMAAPIPASTPTKVQPHDGVDRNPSSAAPNEANHMHPQDLGAQIASAFGYVPGSTASSANNPYVPNSEPKAIETLVDGIPLPVMAGGSPVQKAPNGAVLVAGQTIAQGSQATVSGAVVSVGSNNVVVDGTNHAFSHMAAETLTPIVAGQTFTPNPSPFSVAGTTISAGGPAATINGTIISLQASGTLLVGSSMIPLSTSHLPSDINIDGFDITAKPSFVVVDGATISPAAGGITISGTVVSLETGGSRLDVGSGRFAMPTTTAGAVGGENHVKAFMGGQGRRWKVSLTLSLICGVCGIFIRLISM